MTEFTAQPTAAAHERAGGGATAEGKGSAGAVPHHLTVDVEEYFQVSAMEPYVDRSAWDGFESRVRIGVDRILELLDAAGAKGTFFVLGWIAKRHPDMVRAIAEEGHEIGSHGWDHVRLTHQALPAFRESIRRTKALLEDLSGTPVDGFRAPAFSIVPGLEWALDVLIEEGHRYDSSLFPVRRPGYGYPGGRRDPHVVDRPVGRLVEIPPATLRLLGINLPAAGGGYLRVLPTSLFRAAIRACERREVPATLYTHPWELDPDQPRLGVGLLTRWRHYSGLHRTAPRLAGILREFRFRPVRDTAAEL